MKRLLFIVALFCSASAFAQPASRLLAGQSKPYRTIHPDNVLYVDTLPGGEYRIWAVTVDSILVKPTNIKWLKDSVVMIGNQRYVQLVGSYSNPAFVNSLSAGKVFGLSAVATTGAYGDLTGQPNLGLYYLNSNPNGYISAITFGLVTGALGYTPVNPDGTSGQYIAGNGSKVTFPSIPAAQIQSDWSQGNNSLADFIKNKPTLIRTEGYSGTTNASGEYTVTFGTAFGSTPKVVASVVTTDNKANIIVTSRSTTGFTVRAVTYNVVSVLGIEVIAGAPVAINGATVNVIVSQ